MAHQLKEHTALAGDTVRFPAPTWSDSESPATPAPGDPVPLIPEGTRAHMQ